MRTTTSAAGASLLFNLVRGAASAYSSFWMLVVGPTYPVSAYAPCLALASSLVGLVALYPIPFVFFFWLGQRAIDLAHELGTVVAAILAGSFAGYVVGFVAPILAYAIPVSLASSVSVFGVLQPFFVSFSAVAMGYLWKSRRRS